MDDAITHSPLMDRFFAELLIAEVAAGVPVSLDSGLPHEHGLPVKRACIEP